MAQERRLQLLELAVLGMSDKFDAVLSSIVTRDSAHDASTHCHNPASDQRPAVTLDRPAPVASTPVDRRQQQPPLDDFITQQLRREEFHVPEWTTVRRF